MIATLVQIVVAASWLVVLTLLVLDLTGLRRRGAYLRWQATGWLLMMAVILTSQFAELRGWPNSKLHVIHMVELPVVLAGVALVGVGLLVQARTRHGGVA